MIGHETKDYINLYPESYLNGSVTSGTGAIFLLALNASLWWFLHKTLKDEQELVTYKKKIVISTKQVEILVLGWPIFKLSWQYQTVKALRAIESSRDGTSDVK